MSVYGEFALFTTNFLEHTAFMLKTIYCLLALTTALSGCAATPGKASATTDPVYTVSAKPLEVTVNVKKSVHYLSQIARQVRDADADGLTMYGLDYSVDVSHKTPVITFMATDVTVYLAQELKPDSCRYAIVLDHEFKHVNTLQHVLDEAAQQLQESLGSKPLPVEELQSRVLAAYKKMGKDLDAAQEAVDSAQEAQRIDNYCHHNIPEGVIKKFENGLITYAPFEGYAQPPRLHKTVVMPKD